MLYMIELRFDPEHRDSALNYFWKHGSRNYEGKVTVQNLWVASQDRIAYALISGWEADEVEKACSPLEEFGEVTVRPVVSSDEL